MAMKKPFIKLFRTPNAKYCFDVNKHEFLEVSDESFEYLYNLMTEDDFSDESRKMPEEFESFIVSGYFSDESAIEKIQHPYSDIISTFLDRKLIQITLQLTQDCNLRCTYCVYTESENEESRQRGHTKQKMCWETAKKAVDFLWEHSVDSPRVNVGFYGGEPLLEFSLLQQIVSYCVERFSGKKLTFSVTTNGTLLTDEIIDYFAKHDIPVMISLDGPKEINDKNRVFVDGSGTFDTIMSNIRRVKEIAPAFSEKLQVNMVMDPENDFDCINSICLKDNDLEKLAISATVVEHDYKDTTAAYSEAYLSKMEYQLFLALLARFNRISDTKISPISNSFVGSIWEKITRLDLTPGLRVVDVPSGPCISGQMRLFVDVDGQFFPCERVSEKSEAMKIGNLNNGFDYGKVVRQLEIGKMTEDICKNCWCIRHCELCVKKADDGSGILSAERKLSFCKGVEASVYENMRYYLLFNEIPFFYQQQTCAKDDKGGITV